MADEEAAEVLVEGEHDLMNPKVRSRSHMTGDKAHRFTGAPDDEQLRVLLKRLGPDADKKAKKGAGFKQLIGVPSMKGWVLRVRHYINNKYYRCLQYQGFCPMCTASELDKKAKTASDAYIGLLIHVVTDVDGNPILKDGALEWVPAFSIIGGKKVERLRDLVSMYDSNAAGIPIQTVLTNPEFADWECSAWPDRSAVSKQFVEQLCNEANKSLVWKDEVLQRLAEEGLKREVWERFLCTEVTAADAVKDFNLKSQEAALAELTKQPKKAVDTAPQKTAEPQKESSGNRLLEEAQEEPGTTAHSSVLDEL